MQSKLSENKLQYSLFKYQVSGKAPKLVTSDKKIILKCHIELQQQFYIYLSLIHNVHLDYRLKKFVPQYFGSINLTSRPQIQYSKEGDNKQISVWLEHVKIRYDKKNEGNKFILLRNFLETFKQPNVLDVKIGGRQEKPKKITKAVEQYKMKLNGMLKTDCDNCSDFISKYQLNQVTDFQQTTKYLAYFFSITGKLQVEVLTNIVQQLQQLVIAVRSARGWKFVSTSICMIYDSANPKKIEVKYIDFARAKIINQLQQKYDEQTSAGVEYVINMIKQIINQSSKYQNIKIDKKQNEEVVPLSKVKKFQTGSDRKFSDNQIKLNSEIMENETQFL